MASSAFLGLAAKGFVEFMDSGGPDRFDAYVITYDDEGAGDSIRSLSGTVRDLFRALSDGDPAHDNCMGRKVDDPSWRFTFGGAVFYPITLAPCYPAESSRYNGGTPHTDVLFLPRAAFERRQPAGKNTLSETARQQIRREHAKHGMVYDLTISLGPFECYKVVKPINLGDQVIRWWE
ncbi:MAG: YqcI/YcgG family protein [Fimbriimonadaceae bacterium]